MISTINHPGGTFRINFSQPIDISIPLRAGKKNVNAWYSKPVSIEPVVMGSFIGEVSKGGPVNFRDVFLNPHGNGTHTECVGHISSEWISLNQCLKKFFFLAELISVTPEKISGDWVITLDQVKNVVTSPHIEALVIRTMPNEISKMERQYSETNPPYLDHQAAKWMADRKISHLLLDLPSVDREVDGGKLLAHHAFWNYPANPRMDCTISELIYVPDHVPDGIYFLNIQITALENDASPSKPVLYKTL